MSELYYKRRTLFSITVDDSHLQLEKEFEYVLWNVVIQSDQITEMSINFLFWCLPETNNIFFHFFFEITQKKEMQEFIQVCHCDVLNCILSQCRQSVL